MLNSQMLLNTVRHKRNSIEVLKDVVFALFLREIKTRFGAYRLGLLWAFLEPMAFVVILTGIRSLSRTGTLFAGESHGIPYPLFFTLGYVPFQLFSKLLSQGAAAVNSNQGLFNYRQVRPLDALLARTLLEILVFSTVLLLFLSLFWWFGFNATISNPLEFMTVLLLLTLFGGGIGMIICVGQLRLPELGKIVPLLTRPLFFISGLFFSINDIPSQYQHYLLWNPILHAIELIRGACYPSFNTDSVSMSYLTFFALLTSFFGLALYRLEWKRMVAS
jgi:capsular polysaccharide transport system permease protein